MQVSDRLASVRALFPGRKDLIGEIRRKRFFDLVIVGGGIHGAVFARLAAFNGLATLLLERDDYAFDTSSRSSKMAHGGLRYLEHFDFKQVFEGIRAREALFRNASHLVWPHPFFIPVAKGESLFKFKLGLGLKLYDYFLKDKARYHRWFNPETLSSFLNQTECQALQGGFLYTDGLMRDARLVMENIIAARQEGALCLNYANFDSFSGTADGTVHFGWHDVLSREKYSGSAGLIVNCAGPWVPYAGRITPAGYKQNIRYSRGIHLLFNKPWTGPARFLPLADKGRYYFIWPYGGRSYDIWEKAAESDLHATYPFTMVGTTEREVTAPERDPLPRKDEVNELLARLEQDLPSYGLDRDSLYYGFAGQRTVPLRSAKADVTSESRRHIWHYQNRILSLIGGKFTTAYQTALEGLKRVFKIAAVEHELVSLEERPLPGSCVTAELFNDFSAKAKAVGLSERGIALTVSRMGRRVEKLLDDQSLMKPLSNDLLRGEVEFAILVEQAENLRDLMERRLGIAEEPGHGLDVLEPVLEVLAEHKPDLDINAEESRYRKRIKMIKDCLS